MRLSCSGSLVPDSGVGGQRGWGRPLGRETEAGGKRNPPQVACEDRKTHGGPAGPAAAHGHTGPSSCSHPGTPHSPRRPGSCRPRADAGAGRARGSGGGSSNSSKSGSSGPIPAAGWSSVHGRAGARTDRVASEAAPAPFAELSALLRRRRPSFSTGQRHQPHPHLRPRP